MGEDRNKSLVMLAVLGPLLLIVSLLAVVVMIASSSTACTPAAAAGPDAAAVAVDPATVPAGPIAGYGGDQLVNAAHIMLAGQQLGLSLRDQQIGVMTAMGESSLQVLDRGDAVGPDSRGLFQQRDNGAWGTLADRMDPFTSATNFFTAMTKIADRDTLAPTIVAHRTQRNADPYHYEPHWLPAIEVVEALGGIAPADAPTGVDETGVPVTDYTLGPVQPQLAALVNALAPRFNITTVGGYRESARDPGGHPSGLAADFMTDSKAQGDALAEYARTNAAALGIDYIIWYQRIWSPERAAEGWRPMEDRGSPTQNHTDHVHINALPDPGAATGTLTPVDPVDGEACETPGLVASTWVEPLPGAPVTSDYGSRVHPVTGQDSFHYGVDYGAACETPFRAAGGGIVTQAGPDSIYGHLVEIDHGAGIVTRYGHMVASGVDVRVGDQVLAGDVIGRVGAAGLATGCHLHFEVDVDGETVDPVEFLAAPPVPAGGSFTLAQANILTSLSPERFTEDLSIVTAARPDFVTLNEAGGRSDEQIRPPGYSSWRGPSDSNWIRETPLLWRTDRWTPLDIGTELMHNQPQFRGPKVTYGVRFANWATLRSVDGQTVSVVSFHASPTYTPLRTLLIARLGGLVARLSQAGPVLVGGDLNVHYLSRAYPRGQLTAAGLVSTFDALGQPANGWATGTHNGATIDYLFASGAVQPISHNTYDLNSSDHRLLMGTFK